MQMSRVYHEKTRYTDYSNPPPPKKKKKKKKGEAWKRVREEVAVAHRQIGITIRQTQKTCTLYQKDSSFMTLKEVQIENVKKGEMLVMSIFSFSYNVFCPFRHKFHHLLSSYTLGTANTVREKDLTYKPRLS